MIKIKRQLRRLLVSVLLAAILCTGDLNQLDGSPFPLAWWGSLYPKFCFGRMLKEEKEDRDACPKISFYLAKLLDW